MERQALCFSCQNVENFDQFYVQYGNGCFSLFSAVVKSDYDPQMKIPNNESDSF